MYALTCRPSLTGCTLLVWGRCKAGNLLNVGIHQKYKYINKNVFEYLKRWSKSVDPWLYSNGQLTVCRLIKAQKMYSLAHINLIEYFCMSYIRSTFYFKTREKIYFLVIKTHWNKMVLIRKWDVLLIIIDTIHFVWRIKTCSLFFIRPDF